MLKEKIIFLLCFFCVSNSLARLSHLDNTKYGYRVEGRRQPFNREIIATTTPRPIQRYWQSFVRNLPTLPPITWNVAKLFNGNSQQIIENPVEVSTTKPYDTNRIHKKSRPKKYYTTYDNNYQQLQLLGLDRNRIMHFYEPSTGQYYALQVQLQTDYYKNYYENPYTSPYYYNHYNNYGGYYEDNNGSDGEYEYKDGYNSADGYDYDQQYYYENSQYNTDFSEYNNENEPNQEENTEYDDGVELVDNWGYTDDEIFADRKFKGRPNKSDTIFKRIIKIQKNLLKPETEEEAKKCLSKQRIKADKNESTPTKNTAAEYDETSLRNVVGTFKRNDNQKRKKQSTKTRANLRLKKKPSRQVGYYMLPTKQNVYFRYI